MGVELTKLNSHTGRGYSDASSSDGTHIVSGFDNSSIPAWNMAQHQHHWMVTPENWIVWLPYHQRLMSIPPEVREILRRPDNPLVISRKGSATIDFVYPYIGTEWVGCYTPSVRTLAAHGP